MNRLLLIFLLLSSVGCTHLYKNYDYEIHKDSRKGELLVVELYGSWKKISENPEITKKKSS